MACTCSKIHIWEGSPLPDVLNSFLCPFPRGSLRDCAMHNDATAPDLNLTPVIKAVFVNFHMEAQDFCTHPNINIRKKHMSFILAPVNINSAKL